MPKIKILSLVAIFSTTSIIAIATTVKSVKPQVPPELDRLEYFQGTWRCQQPALPASPSSIFTWTVKRDLNNFWYLGNAEETQSADDSQPINSREFLGYNIASQKLFRSVVVGNGNFFNLTASNWRDNKLVWSGTVVDQDKGESIPLREEIVRDSQDRFTATYFIADEKDNWKPVVDETCDRIK